MTGKNGMEHEAVQLLRDYIRIDTTNPPGNEIAACNFFSAIFDAEGIAHKTYEPAPARGSIRAVIPSKKKDGDPTKKKPLLIMHHSDVVPAIAEEWTVHPFAGETRDGFLYGRGAIDTKGLGIMELVAFLTIKRVNFPLSRDLIFLAAADEEMGGSFGCDYLLKHHLEDFEADIALNEGGIGILDLIPNRPLVTIASAEKGCLWLKLSRSGPPGHASAPHGDNALERLVVALAHLLNVPRPLMIKPIAETHFLKLAEGMPILKPYLENKDPETLKKILIESGLLAQPEISAQFHNTISLTVMTAGNKTNIIPSKAVAHLDTRLLPGEDINGMIDFVKRHLEDNKIEIKIIAQSPANESSFLTPDFEILTEAFKKHYPDAVITPYLLNGGSDSRFLRDHGIPTYGVFPAFYSLSDISTMTHGIDERISVSDIITGTAVMTDIIKKLCA